MPADEVVDFLMGSAGPAVKFENIGDVVAGRIVKTKKQQQKDMKTGALKFWDGGDPMFEVVVWLQTDQRDPTIEGDDGVRRLFVRGQMTNAVRDAVTKSGFRGQTLVGGTLKVKFQEEGEPPQRGFNPPKIFRAIFEPPAAVDEFDAVPAANGEAPLIVQHPAAQDRYDDYSEEPF